MNYEEWKEAFGEMLEDDWRLSGTKMSFVNWCKDVWDKRMAEIQIEAHEYAKGM